MNHLTAPQTPKREHRLKPHTRIPSIKAIVSIIRDRQIAKEEFHAKDRKKIRTD